MTILTKIVNIKYNVDVLSPNFLSPLQQHGGGNGGLRYCGIKLFFKRYFGKLDFKVRYCGIIYPCGMRKAVFFILLHSVKEHLSQYCGTVHCALLSNARQYF